MQVREEWINTHHPKWLDSAINTREYELLISRTLILDFH